MKMKIIATSLNGTDLMKGEVTQMTEKYMSDSIGALGLALSKFQGEVPSIPKKKWNKYDRYYYADLAEILAIVYPVLAKYGLAITQLTLPQEDPSFIAVRTILIHGESGEWVFSDCALPAGKTAIEKDDLGKDTKTRLNIVNQRTMGAGVTYARRYGLCAILGITADEDTAGNQDNKNEHTDGNQNSNNEGPKNLQTKSKTQQLKEAREKAAANNPDPPARNKLQQLLMYVGKECNHNRDAMLAHLSTFFNRELTSSNELTADEIDRYLATRENPEVGNE